MKRCVLTLLLIVTVSTAMLSAQQRERTRGADGSSPDRQSHPCVYIFSSGANNTALDYCVSAFGNIITLQTPAGQDLLSGSDGYGICNESPVATYWDYAADGESAWNQPVTQSQTSKSVKIARTTGDGIWTLTQTFTQDAKTPGVRVAMTLKNNSTSARVAYLVRYADVNIGTNPLNNFDATANGASGWTSTTGLFDGFGMTLENVGNSQFGYHNGFAQNTYRGPNPCAFAFNSPFATIVDTDGSVVLAYADTIGAGKTKTATMIYRGL